MSVFSSLSVPSEEITVLLELDLPSCAPPTAGALPDLDDADGWPRDSDVTL